MVDGDLVTQLVRPVSMTTVIKEFWAKVTSRLVKIHRLKPDVAVRAVRQYRRRVGNVAMNDGYQVAARDIASAVRAGGFVWFRRTAGGQITRKKVAV